MASLISVPLQGNWDFGLGDRDATGTLLNIQPVMPFGVSQSTNIILRVIMPLTSQPGVGRRARQRHGRHRGDRVLLPVENRAADLGRGPGVPAAGRDQQRAGSEKFGIGPSVVALVQPGKWTLGALFNQIWSVERRQRPR